MWTLYGIANCDTVRRARRYLDGVGQDYQFHDFRRDGLGETLLREWVAELGWDTLLNRRGLTWRRLPEAARSDLNQERAVGLMLENPTLIKRPILDTGTQRVIGFSEDRYADLSP